MTHLIQQTIASLPLRTKKKKGEDIDIEFVWQLLAFSSHREQTTKLIISRKAKDSSHGLALSPLSYEFLASSLK